MALSCSFGTCKKELSSSYFSKSISAFSTSTLVLPLSTKVFPTHSISFAYASISSMGWWIKGPSLTFFLFLVMNSKWSYLHTKLLWNAILCRINYASFPASLELHMKGPNWSLILKLAFFLALTNLISSTLMICL